MSAKSGDTTLQLASHVTKVLAPTAPRQIPGNRSYIKSAMGTRLQKASNYSHAQKSSMHTLLTDKPCTRHHNSLLLECASCRQERRAGGHTKDVATEEGCLFSVIQREISHQCWTFKTIQNYDLPLQSCATVMQYTCIHAKLAIAASCKVYIIFLHSCLSPTFTGDTGQICTVRRRQPQLFNASHTVPSTRTNLTASLTQAVPQLIMKPVNFWIENS